MTADTQSDLLEQATALQRLAADPRHSAWVSANAGTGKTRVLTDRIARLLLRRVRPEKILCLTYTKAAAAEMKNRISERLGNWAVLDDTALTEELLALTGRNPAPEDLIRARRLFAETLDAPGGINVRTIHAFCESLLARFPIEAGVAPHAAIIDERDAKALQSDAQSDLFQRLAGAGTRSDDAELAASAGYLAAYLSPDDFSKRIRELLSERVAMSLAVAAHGGVEGVIGSVFTALGVDRSDTEDSVISAACADAAFDGDCLRDAAEALADGNKTERDHAITITGWLRASPRERAAEHWAAYCDVFVTGAGTARADRGLISVATKEARPDVDRIVHDEQDRIVATGQRLRAVRTATGTAHLVRIGWAILNEYERLKTARAALDYDDLIIKALALLENEPAVAWVHYKLDNGIDHVLVDEAQDTSPPQWEIIKRLCIEMFAGLGTRDEGADRPESEPPDRSVFAVGDEKQSIYSFQGADPAGFSAAREWFGERADAAGKALERVDLIQSFRSTAPVLGAVDTVFAREPAREGVVPSGSAIRHQPYRHADAGSVALWPAIERPEEGAKSPWQPLDGVRAQSPLAQTAERVAGTISRWIAEQAELPALGRPIDAGDVMILVERRSQFAEEMVKQLKRKGIPVAGSDRMKLAEQMAVMDLMAAAATAMLIDDDLSLAVVLKGPFVGLSEEELYELARDRGDDPAPGSLWPALEARARGGEPPWAPAHAVIRGLRAAADTVPPFEFFSTLLGAGRGRHALYARLGIEVADPIDEFLGQALMYERDHAPSLQGFLQWAASGGTEIKRDMEVVHRAVRVMTVHGAKGLEAPIVILPDTCGDNTTRNLPAIYWLGNGATALPIWPGAKENHTEIVTELRDRALADRQAENHRLLYVAMTRARDQLHVAGWERARKPKGKDHGRKEGSWYELIRPALEEMAGNEPFDAPGGEGLRVTSPQVAEPRPDGTEDRAAPPDLKAEPWMTLEPAPETDPPDPLTPSRPADDDPAALSPFAGDDMSRFRRGRLIHRLLQTLPDIDAAEWERAATAWLAVAASDLDDAQRDAVRDETLAVLREPAFADAFGPESLAEVPIAGLVEIEGARRAIAGQVDRLVVTDERVTIIDYKTNRPPPTDETDVPAVYIRQMAAYRTALATVYPGREIACVLLWTDGPRAMVLSNARLDSEAPG
ncbi:MAG: double-strand break repair helicase AddA [Rhodospirillales bacterium]